MNNTERPITVKEGTNTVVGNNPDKIINTTLNALKNQNSRKKILMFQFNYSSP